MGKLTQYERDSLQKLGESIHSGKWSNEGLVQIIELSGAYLNLKTISDYSRQNKISYNGVKHNRPITKLFNVKFVVDT